MKQVLKVRRIIGGEVVKEVDVTGKSERSIERVIAGMLINMSPDFYVDDSEAYEPQTRKG